MIRETVQSSSTIIFLSCCKKLESDWRADKTLILYYWVERRVVKKNSFYSRSTAIVDLCTGNQISELPATWAFYSEGHVVWYVTSIYYHAALALILTEVPSDVRTIINWGVAYSRPLTFKDFVPTPPCSFSPTLEWNETHKVLSEHPHLKHDEILCFIAHTICDLVISLIVHLKKSTHTLSTQQAMCQVLKECNSSKNASLNFFQCGV